ncbi:4981_t:CDS:2 [Ambispora gerdemannii]|uniref:4981_t:CDS:1 n=1 Tax=Ambispora gerdemannii TaxID=144530 RepID=A0A9N8ZFB2_9GLOM|nr:4981_t:CDS:2 [Ambispora gerdemannii]
MSTSSNQVSADTTTTDTATSTDTTVVDHPLAENVRPLSPTRGLLISHIIELYSCKPTREKFRFYNEDALFEDPVMIAPGLENIKAQFYAMPKIFSKSTPDSYKVLKNDEHIIEIDLNQRYFVALFNKEIVHHSFIRLELDTNEKIVKHTDLWNGKPLYHEGIIGGISSFFRRTNARLVSTFVRIPEIAM